MIIYNDIKFYDSGNGYMKNPKVGFLHRYIYTEAFGPIPEGYIVHHKNHDKSDNRLENLECISDAEHRSLHNKGHSRNKLTSAIKEQVKQLFSEGKSMAYISKTLHIGYATVFDITHNRRKHEKKINYDFTN